MGTIKHPFAPMETQVLTAAATVAATVNRPCILQIGSAAISDETTLNLTVGDEVIAGDKIYITWLNPATKEDVIAGTGFKGATTMAGVNSKTVTAEAVYDGSAFHVLSVNAQ